VLPIPNRSPRSRPAQKRHVQALAAVRRARDLGDSVHGRALAVLPTATESSAPDLVAAKQAADPAAPPLQRAEDKRELGRLWNNLACMATEAGALAEASTFIDRALTIAATPGNGPPDRNRRDP
jgi:hypothetical protein